MLRSVNYSLKFIILYLFSIFLSVNLYAVITEYQVTNYYGTDQNGNIYFITRSFNENNIPKILAVSIYDYQTVILHKNIIEYIQPSKQLQLNKKIFKHAIHKGNSNQAIYLTVDLCPSSKPGFEREFFEALIAYGQKHNKPINIAIALTATWAIKHQREFELLKTWAKNKDLLITWMNHSYTHFYQASLPLDHNFMLHPSTDPEAEVINNEIFMLEHGIVPSLFFRYPGLIYNKTLHNKIRKLNLIVIDADAWLAKTRGEFSPSSIILVHGNKNETIGIKLFLNLLQEGAFDDYNFENLNHLLSSNKN